MSSTSKKNLMLNRADYYEAVIQIRPINEKIISYVRKLVGKRKDVFISNETREKFGHDFYISDRKYAAAIGKKLKAQFKKGILKVSKKLHGYNRQESKNIYRVVICFRYDDEKEQTNAEDL